MQIGLTNSLVGVRGGNSLASNIRALFANDELGVIYDPSVFSALYQDGAEPVSVPVTTDGQPIRAAMDISRPSSSRRNLYSNTEFFRPNLGFGTANGTLEDTSEAPPQGVRLAKQLTHPGGTTGPILQVGMGASALPVYLSIFVKYKDFQYFRINGTGQTSAVFNIQNGTVVSSGTWAAGIEDAGNGWYRLTASRTATPNIQVFGICDSTGAAVSGVDGQGTYVAGPQFERNGLTEFQAVGQPSSVETAWPGIAAISTAAGTRPLLGAETKSGSSELAYFFEFDLLDDDLRFQIPALLTSATDAFSDNEGITIRIEKEFLVQTHGVPNNRERLYGYVMVGRMITVSDRNKIDSYLRINYP